VTRVAAIDCGTNSVRLLVADVRDPELTELVRRMEIVRLGEGVDRTGRLTDAAIARTRAALRDYAEEIRRRGAERVRMVATSATRDAANAEEFTAMVVEAIGVTPEVVTGQEEARLGYLGAVRVLPADARPPYLVVDIGGGSTEFVTETRSISVDMGCVRMTERYLRGDPPTPAEVAAAEAEIRATVDRALATVDGEFGTLIGLAGSVGTVTAIALDLPAYLPDRVHHARIPYPDVVKVTEQLLAMPRARRLALPVMHPGRADVIGAGALILRMVMEGAGADSLVHSEHDILDGIAWGLA
jgi:exopolyphosphatase/guanosine-5'-triphosphate,3'-diphosphate pyrophosphatase